MKQHQINGQNVQSLALRWTFRTGIRATFQATPLRLPTGGCHSGICPAPMICNTPRWGNTNLLILYNESNFGVGCDATLGADNAVKAKDAHG